jgi:hypothetical protein
LFKRKKLIREKNFLKTEKIRLENELKNNKNDEEKYEEIT